MRKQKIKYFGLVNTKCTCQICKKKYIDEMILNGSTVLEVQHCVRVADGGEDKPNNTIIVCPNCHKELDNMKNEQLLQLQKNAVQKNAVSFNTIVDRLYLQEKLSKEKYDYCKKYYV